MKFRRPLAVSSITQLESFQKLRQATSSVFGTIIPESNERKGMKNLLWNPPWRRYVPNPNFFWAARTGYWNHELLERAKLRLERRTERGKLPPKKGHIFFFLSFFLYCSMICKIQKNFETFFF